MAFGDLVQAKRGTTSVTLTSTPTAGNLLVFAAFSNGNVTFTAPSGFTGGTAVATSGGNSRGSQCAWKISAGTETGAISPASGTPTYCCIAEYAGPFDATPKEAENNALVSALWDATAITPTAGTRRLLVAAQGSENAGATAWLGNPQVNGSSVGVSPDLSTTGDGFLFHLVIASASGSYTANEARTTGGSLAGETAAMTFIPAGRATKNTRGFPLGTEIGMNWRGAA